jgi:hypothetical protein
MRKDAAELLKDALSLDREIDEGAEQAWLDEIQKRLRDIDTGAVALLPWEEAERRLWAKVPSR